MKIYGVRIDGVTLEEAVERARGQERCTVFTPNAVMLDACRRDASYAELLCRADLSLADGQGTLMAARRRGEALPCRVSGIDFAEALMGRAEGERVFLLGGTAGVAEEAARRLAERYPRLTVCGWHHGYFEKTGEQNESVLEKIRACKPDWLFVCFGFPAQEQWIVENVERVPSVRVAAGLGGSLDVWAGRLRRAPRIVRSLRLEWAWRMVREPRRLRHLPALIRISFGRERKNY